MRPGKNARDALQAVAVGLFFRPTQSSGRARKFQICVPTVVARAVQEIQLRFSVFRLLRQHAALSFLTVQIHGIECDEQHVKEIERRCRRQQHA